MYRFLETHASSFRIPSLFSFMGNPDDEIKTVSLAHPQLYKETEKRCKEIGQTVKNLQDEEIEVLFAILSISIP